RNQPVIGGWNLARFAETLLQLLHDDQDHAVELAQKEISEFIKLYHHHWLTGMRAKLGIFNEEAEDESLIEGLLSIMHKHSADYTNTFLALTHDKLDNGVLFGTDDFKQWYQLWQARLSRQQE